MRNFRGGTLTQRHGSLQGIPVSLGQPLCPRCPNEIPGRIGRKDTFLREASVDLPLKSGQQLHARETVEAQVVIEMGVETYPAISQRGVQLPRERTHNTDYPVGQVGR